MTVIRQTNKELTGKEFTEIIAKLNLLHQLQNATNIVIKPNLAAGGYVAPDSHVVSDLNLLSDVIACIRKINSNAMIYIAESDSTGYGYAFLKFENLKLHQYENDKVKLLDLSRDHLTKIENQRFRYFTTLDKQLWLSTTLDKSDFFISLANIKTHSITKFTGVCKNLFGVLPTMNKNILHPNIHEVVHDLVLATTPHLSITDGFYGMEGNGPVGGDKRNIGIRLFGNDAFELDCQAAELINIHFGSVKYLKLLSLTRNYTPEKSHSESRFKLPGKLLRVNNYIGLQIQSAGHAIMELGHRIHIAETPFQLLVAVFRPILLRFIPLETLKSIKRRLINE